MKLLQPVVAFGVLALACAAPAFAQDTAPAADAASTVIAATADGKALAALAPTDVPNGAEIVGEGGVKLATVAGLFQTKTGTISSVSAQPADGSAAKKLDSDGFRVAGGKLVSSHTAASFASLPTQ